MASKDGTSWQKTSPGKGAGKGAAPGKAPPPKAKSAATPKRDALPFVGKRLQLKTLPGTTIAEAFKSFRTNSFTGEGEKRTVDVTAIDVDELQMFAPKARSSPASASSKAGGKGGGKREKAIEVLPRDVAQNFGLVLRQSKVDTVLLAKALIHLTPDPKCNLTADSAEQLVKNLPNDEQLYSLMLYKFEGKDPQMLRDIEQQLMPLAELKRLKERFKVLDLPRRSQERLQDALCQLAKLQSGCHAVRGSGVLRDLLQIVLALFNYVNLGKAPADTEAAAKAGQVDVHSLMRLQETQAPKGPFPGYNMLHYCVKELLRQRPELRRDHWKRQLGALPDAARVSLVNLQHELDKLKEDQAFISKELSGHAEDYRSCFVKEPCEDPVAEPLASPPVTEVPDDDEEVIPRHDSRLSLGARFLAKFIDAGNLVKDVIHGDAVLGRGSAVVPANTSADAEAPPPGYLWKLSKSGRWRRHWCEVRSSVLVLYRTQDEIVLGTTYVVLPSAELATLDSLLASDDARKLAGAKPYGFELRAPGRSDTLIFSADTELEAKCWVELLDQHRCQPGVGYLSVHAGGRTGWQHLFCVVERATDATSTSKLKIKGCENRLLGFVHPRHYIDGRAPVREWPLDNVNVRPFESDSVSEEAQKLRSSTPYGLEVEDYYDTSKLLHLSCDSFQAQSLWQQALENTSHQSEKPHVRAPQTLYQSFCLEPSCLDENENELFDLFSEHSPLKAPAGQTLSFAMTSWRMDVPTSEKSSLQQTSALLNSTERTEANKQRSDTELSETLSSCTGSLVPQEGDTSGLTSETEQPNALAQLQHFDAEMAQVVAQWSHALAATEADCRSLLRFFGLEAPSDGTGLARAALKLLEALSTFMGQVSQAWERLDKHADGQKRRNSTS